MDFVLCEDSKGVVQVASPSIVILLTWWRVSGLKMVSVIPHLDCSHPNISPSMHQINLSEELTLVNMSRDLLCYAAYEALARYRTIIFSFSSNQNIFHGFGIQPCSHISLSHAEISPHTHQTGSQIWQKMASLEPWFLFYVKHLEVVYRF